jgi:hypothetical protein
MIDPYPPQVDDDLPEMASQLRISFRREPATYFYGRRKLGNCEPVAEASTPVTRASASSAMPPFSVDMMYTDLSPFHLTFDRAAERPNPMTCVWKFQERPPGGTDDGATKTRCVARMRRVTTMNL